MNLRPALLALVPALLVGCDDGPGPGVVAKSPPKPVANPPAPVVKEKPPEKAKPILGERTQDVKDAQAELKKGSAVAAPPRAIAKDPITLSGNTYVYAIGKTSIDNIKHAIDLYQATNGEYPKTYEEFMEKIIKENNISLPVLPYYQSYSYDKDKHLLIILEYPDKKAAGPGR
jgi:hypothetical protein